MKRNNNVIYLLKDPRPETNFAIRYVGQSINGKGRLYEHTKPSSLIDKTHKTNWIKQLLSLNLKPIFCIHEVHTDPKILPEREIYWIAYFKDLGCNLTNSTDGGEGTLGYKHKAETIEVLSEKRKLYHQNKGYVPSPINKLKEENGVKYKNCAKCLEDKEISNFTPKRKANSYQAYCKPCSLKHTQEYRKKNPHIKLSKEAYVLAHKNAYAAGGEASKRPERRKQISEQKSKPIEATHTQTGEILTFVSARAALSLGFFGTNISRSMRLNKPYKGYVWKFI